MISKAYSEAIVETLDILEHTNKEDVDKISNRFMEFLNTNKSKTYISNLDHKLEISNMNLKRETKILLSIIYRQFWCNSEEKKIFDQTIKNNELIYKKQLQEKYNTGKLFRTT